MNKFNKVKKIALKLGADDIRVSKKKYKKYDVLYNNKWISFGDNRYEDWHDHKDKKRRENYRKRASKIKNKKGQLTYKDPTTANFWAFNVLW